MINIGRKLIDLVENPYEWYDKEEFKTAGVGQRIFDQMSEDSLHLMLVGKKGELAFLGGYALGFALREGMGIRDLLKNKPKPYQYVDPFRLAQCMEISPDALPEIVSHPRIKPRSLIERVQIEDSLLFRIYVGTLGYLSLPAVKQTVPKDAELAELVKKFRLTGNEVFRSIYLTKVRKLVEGIVEKNFKSSSEKSGEAEMLISVGLEGAKESFDSFNLEKGVKMETYIPFRVRGSIQDYLRVLDEVPRNVRLVSSRMKKIIQELTIAGEKVSLESVTKKLTKKHSPQAIEQAYRLAVGEGNGQNTSLSPQQTNDSAKFVTLGDRIVNRASDSFDPSRVLAAKDSVNLLIGFLSRQEQEIVIRYYLRSETMKEIGGALGLSESRISQTHDSILVRLREIANERGEDSFI